jgi:radical SAM protein with 4Fe4S-binding SPASM domain
VKFRIDPILNPALDGSARPIFFRLPPEKIVALDKADPERASLWRDQFQNNQVIPPSDQRMYLCGASKQGFHIDAVGHLFSCLINRQPSYDLRSGSFREGWDQFLPKVISREYNANFPCLGCDLRSVCSQCPALAELEHGDCEKRVEFLCQIAKLRRDVFAQPI